MYDIFKSSQLNSTHFSGLEWYDLTQVNKGQRVTFLAQLILIEQKITQMLI